jgi:protein PhnA
MLEKLKIRANKACELCSKTEDLSVYVVDGNGETDENTALVCAVCSENLAEDELDANYWRCLNDSMWNTNPAVQIVVWQTLDRLKDKTDYAQNLKDMLYLDEATQERITQLNLALHTVHKDSNGSKLAQGDTVVLIKDLEVKGAGFTAKRGTAVRNINLVLENPAHIEGKINGQQIVILTKYVKKST